MYAKHYVPGELKKYFGNRETISADVETISALARKRSAERKA
jgi:hypothetical protein